MGMEVIYDRWAGPSVVSGAYGTAAAAAEGPPIGLQRQIKYATAVTAAAPPDSIKRSFQSTKRVGGCTLHAPPVLGGLGCMYLEIPVGQGEEVGGMGSGQWIRRSMNV